MILTRTYYLELCFPQLGFEGWKSLLLLKSVHSFFTSRLWHTLSLLGWINLVLIYSNVCICSFNSYTIDISQYSFRYAILKVINILILDINWQERITAYFLIFLKYLDTDTNLCFIECLKEHAFWEEIYNVGFSKWGSNSSFGSPFCSVPITIHFLMCLFCYTTVVHLYPWGFGSRALRNNQIHVYSKYLI